MVINTIGELEREAGEIDAYLSALPPGEPSLVIEHGNEVAVYIARTGKMLADARYHLNVEMATTIVRELGKQAGCPPSVLKQLVSSSCARASLLVDTIERQNRAATHRLDWLRTVVSHAKEEMRLSNGISQG